MNTRALRNSLLVCLAGISTPFMAQAAHPLITEDTGTQGTGHYQLEANIEHSFQDGDGNQTHAWVKAATLSYGFRDDTDLMLTLQHSETSVLTSGERLNERGFNDLALDVKWRFYENEGLSYGIKPGVTLPTGDENKGWGAGKTTLGAMLFSTVERDAWLFNWHIGYKRNNNSLDERENLWHLSGSVWRKVSEDLKLVADIGTDTNPDKSSNDRPRFLVLGIIHSPRENLDLDLGLRKEIWGPAVNYVGLGGLTYRW